MDFYLNVKHIFPIQFLILQEYFHFYLLQILWLI